MKFIQNLKILSVLAQKKNHILTLFMHEHRNSRTTYIIWVNAHVICNLDIIYENESCVYIYRRKLLLLSRLFDSLNKKKMLDIVMLDMLDIVLKFLIYQFYLTENLTFKNNFPRIVQFPFLIYIKKYN